jgi:hypothetical protein
MGNRLGYPFRRTVVVEPVNVIKEKEPEQEEKQVEEPPVAREEERVSPNHELFLKIRSPFSNETANEPTSSQDEIKVEEPLQEVQSIREEEAPVPLQLNEVPPTIVSNQPANEPIVSEDEVQPSPEEEKKEEQSIASKPKWYKKKRQRHHKK